MDALPPSTRNWIKQHPNPDTNATIELACAFHRSLEFKVTPPRSTPSPLRLGSGTSSTGGRRINEDIGKTRGLDRPYIQQPQCFSCGEWGHIARGCPLKTEKPEPMEIGVTRGRVFYTGRRDTPYKKRLVINGKSTVALIDSGCSQSVARAGLFDAHDCTSGLTVSICCIHGETREYPLIWTTLTWGGKEIPIRMGLVEQLVEEAIIGTDFSEFPQVLDSLRQLEETNNWWKDAPFSSEPLSPPRVRPKLSRKEKRIMKKAYTQDLSSTPRVCHLPGDLMGQADYLSRFPDLVGLDQPHSCEGMCNRAPPDAASLSKKTIAKGYPGGTRGIPDVMTSHVIRQTRTADERQAERDREREADVKQSRREERHGSPRGKGSPAVDEDQREESGKPWGFTPINQSPNFPYGIIEILPRPSGSVTKGESLGSEYKRCVYIESADGEGTVKKVPVEPVKTGEAVRSEASGRPLGEKAELGQHFRISKKKVSKTEVILQLISL
ncbi:uncharacterized protein [Pleurodeles waltl]|uniref:uncharacterized protein n=1 Tax=Pleurodeles waltl TaxID=8319 RepID=UPI003709B1C1